MVPSIAALDFLAFLSFRFSVFFWLKLLYQYSIASYRYILTFAICKVLLGLSCIDSALISEARPGTISASGRK